MIDKILKDAEDRMQKSITALKTELGKIRTGRAHPGLLDTVRVNYYGNESPLNQVATVSVEGPRSLTITPYDKSMVPMIEKAIMTSDLGLNPTTAGVVIRVPLPSLTEQRRKDLAKLVKEECERGRVSVRSIRREANQEIKDLLKQKTISEDDERRAETQIQKVTDQYITKVDELSVQKEKDLMEI